MVLGRTSQPGLARIDLNEQEAGCHLVWESSETAQTVVPKLSTGSGLVYVYTKQPGTSLFTDAFYFTAIDFDTGQTIYKQLTGTGLRYDNHFSPVTIGPDGTAYVGSVNGLMALRDRSHGWELTGLAALHQAHTPVAGLGLMLVSAALVWAGDRSLRQVAKRRGGP
jgi:outer membrane protein assembly factor BamB